MSHALLMLARRLGNEIREVRASNTFKGVLVAPEEATAKVEAAIRHDYDHGMAAQAEALANTLPAIKRAIAAEMEAALAPAVPD